MPRIGLEISFETENFSFIEAVGKDFRWFVKICCGNCGEVTDWVYVDEEDTVEVKGGRGTAHMVLNCKVRIEKISKIICAFRHPICFKKLICLYIWVFVP